jgi:hypothetical protein
VITIVALSALTGGITLIFREAITAKERITFKDITELAIPGVGFGAVNGIILAGLFQVVGGDSGDRLDVGWLSYGRRGRVFGQARIQSGAHAAGSMSRRLGGQSYLSCPTHRLSR